MSPTSRIAAQPANAAAAASAQTRRRSIGAIVRRASLRAREPSRLGSYDSAPAATTSSSRAPSRRRERRSRSRALGLLVERLHRRTAERNERRDAERGADRNVQAREARGDEAERVPAMGAKADARPDEER